MPWTYRVITSRVHIRSGLRFHLYNWVTKQTVMDCGMPHEFNLLGNQMNIAFMLCLSCNQHSSWASPSVRTYIGRSLSPHHGGSRGRSRSRSRGGWLSGSRRRAWGVGWSFRILNGGHELIQAHVTNKPLAQRGTSKLDRFVQIRRMGVVALHGAGNSPKESKNLHGRMSKDFENEVETLPQAVLCSFQL